jgi:membrane protein
LTALGTFVGGLLPLSELLLQVLNFGVSLAVITALFALMFKYMPDAKIAWSDVWIGAAITALLFTVGKLLIGLYLGNASVTSTYGAAGSLVVLLLWMYYSAQIFFLGAEFTQVYANRFGSRVVPAENAEPVTATERAEQGIPHEKRGAAPAPAQETTLVPSSGGTLPVVGPYVALERKPDGLAAGQEVMPVMRQHPVLAALITFVAGLGAGAMVAVQSGQHAREQRRRDPAARERRQGRRGWPRRSGRHAGR